VSYKPYKVHLVGEPKTRTLCGLARVQDGKRGKKLLPTYPPNSSHAITCQNCLNLYHGEPTIRAERTW
jgi:hypothetical protein